MTLTPASAALVSRMVAEGEFISADAAVEAALVVLRRESETAEQVRELVREGLRAADAGRVEDNGPEFYARIRSELQERWNSGQSDQSG